MAASILINGQASPVTNLTVGTTLTLTNANNVGVNSWFWVLIDQPTGSTAVISGATSAVATLVLDKEGSYLIQLTVNGTTNTTAVAIVPTLLVGLTLPAAGEIKEANLNRGWAPDLNSNFQKLEVATRTGVIMTCQTSGAIVQGAAVYVTGRNTLVNGQIVPVVTNTNSASPNSFKLLGVVLDTTTAAAPTRVRISGELTEFAVNTSGRSISDVVYLQDDGSLGFTPGSNLIQVGFVSSIGTTGSIHVQSSSGGALSLGTVGSTPNNSGASLLDDVLTLQPADGAHPGLVTAIAQTIGGAKTFSSTISASNLSGTNTGDITISTPDSTPNANGLLLTGQLLQLEYADATHPGAVSSSTQTFGGNKTFTGTIGASNFSGSSSGTNTGDITLATVGSSPSSNAASLSGQVLTLQPADGTNPGVVTAGTQTIGGNKTFTGTITASNFSGSSSGTNTGDITLTAVGSSPSANAASLSGQALTLQPADATHPGVVTSGTQSFGGAKTFASLTTNGGGTELSTGANASIGGTLTVTLGTTLNAATQINSSLGVTGQASFSKAGVAVNVSTGILNCTTRVINNALGQGIVLNSASGILFLQSGINVSTGPIAQVYSNNATLTSGNIMEFFPDGLSNKRASIGFDGKYTAFGTANNLALAGSTTGNPVTLTATGTDTNVTLRLVPQGAAPVEVGPGASGLVLNSPAQLFTNGITGVQGVAFANVGGNSGQHYYIANGDAGHIFRLSGLNNLFAIVPSQTGNPVTIGVPPVGNVDANVSLNLTTKGSGSFVFQPGGVTQATLDSSGDLSLSGTISATNFSGSSSGSNTGDVTLAAFGSTPNANAASLAGQVLTLQPADGTHPGGVSTGTQTFGGAKTFASITTNGGGTELSVTNNATISGTLSATTYQTSTAADMSFTSSVASAGAAAGAFQFNTSNTLAGASDLLFNVLNNGTPKVQINAGGDLVITNAQRLILGGGGNVHLHNTGNELVAVSNPASGAASAGAFQFNANTSLAGASDLLAVFQNASTTELSIDKNGNLSGGGAGTFTLAPLTSGQALTLSTTGSSANINLTTNGAQVVVTGPMTWNANRSLASPDISTGNGVNLYLGAFNGTTNIDCVTAATLNKTINIGNVNATAVNIGFASTTLVLGSGTTQINNSDLEFTTAGKHIFGQAAHVTYLFFVNTNQVSLNAGMIPGTASAGALQLGNSGNGLLTGSDLIVTYYNSANTVSKMDINGRQSLLGWAPWSYGSMQTRTTGDSSFTNAGGNIQLLPDPTLLAGSSSNDVTDTTVLSMVQYTTAASTNGASGFSGPFSTARATTTPFLYAVVRTDPTAVTTVRYYVGVGASSLDQVSTLAGANTVVGAWFRFDTGIGDTNWMCEVSDGTTAAATSSGIAVAAATTYVLSIDMTVSGTAVFYINGVKVVTTSTHVNTSTTALGIEASVTTLANAARSLSIQKVQLQQA